MINTKKIQDNYKKVCENIAKVTEKCQKKLEDITLVAVTKGHSWEEIIPLYESGCKNFGENRLQDALRKIDEAPSDINWHLIGSLQKNKVRKAIGNFVLFQGVDSYELALKISECSAEVNTFTPILIQVNTSCEITKHGFSEEALWNSFEKLSSLPFIRIEGLMTMAPFTDDEKTVRNCFSRLRVLQEKLNSQIHEKPLLKTLSMGMSHDYELAVQEGATMLRIGSALFL